MAENKEIFQGLTLNDLISKDGTTFEVGDDYDMEEDDPFMYTNEVRLTNEEMLKMLNMDDYQNEDDEGIDEAEAVMPCGITFNKYKSKMTDLTGDGKVMKLVRKKGVGEVVPHDAQVTVHYIGYFEYQDEAFDSTYARRVPDTFRLNRQKLIPGLEIGIASMQKHEISFFIIHPDLAFGKCGCAPRIPPDEEVLFAVHLVDYIDNASADTYEHLTYEEKKSFSKIVKCANDLLNTARDSFKKLKTKQAVREYKRAAYWLETARLENAEEEKEMNTLLSKAYRNLAVCYNKENMPRQACIACNKVPIPNAKLHFNYGRALLKMGEFSQAMSKLQLAHKLEPRNKEIIQEIQLVNEKQTKYMAIEKRLWANCFKSSKQADVTNEFSDVAKEMCETFANDIKLLRQPLPEGLSQTEENYIRKQAAILGLSVTSHVKYGKEIVYLSKPQY